MASFAVIGLYGQTIVGTNPTYKRAVLEEFGGIYCVYCPHGHQIIAEMEEVLGDELVLLNYQTGSYAVPIGNDPDLGSDYGEYVEGLSQLAGYPAAMVNRRVFSGLEQGAPGTSALSRTEWNEAVTTILQQPAPVNIAATANLNVATLELELHVEYYYTASANQANNRLHIAVLQNDLLAPQHGGQQGNYYAHQHVVRDFITGTNGHLITHTQPASFGSLVYDLQLPESYRDIVVDPLKIEIVAFITENEMEVLNGISVVPELHTHLDSDCFLEAVLAPTDLCNEAIAPSLIIRNNGASPLTYCEVDYGIVDGIVQTYTWTGYLGNFETTEVSLPALWPTTGFTEQVLFATLQNPNHVPDPTVVNNSKQHAFSVAPEVSEHTLEIAIRTDAYGHETYWKSLMKQAFCTHQEATRL
ncbi:MAG: Omp28-related outer membrane protein [Saprospiraceae bacterium]